MRRSASSSRRTARSVGPYHRDPATRCRRLVRRRAGRSRAQPRGPSPRCAPLREGGGLEVGSQPQRVATRLDGVGQPVLRRWVGASGDSRVGHRAQATRACSARRFPRPGCPSSFRAVNESRPRPDAGTVPFDVVAVGSALVDVLAHATIEDLRRFDMVKGSMALVDLARAASSTKPWDRRRSLGRLGRQHRRGCGRPGGAGRVPRARWPTTSSGRSSFTTSPPPGWSWARPRPSSASLRPRRRPGHGAMPGARHRGRRADHGDPPGGGLDARPRGPRRGARRPGTGRVPGGLPVGPGARPRRPCGGPWRWPTPPTRWWL